MACFHKTLVTSWK